ncbi:MAG TPA: PEP-CTERM sorting domain-containing protein [Vicinamibacterales bacterium]|jgi:hypothetical protein|nr:PEP-CTERM sorting domain-containing protein [Vicinamibacterales bacterium]
MSRWLTSAVTIVAAAAVGLQADAEDVASHSTGLVHATPEPAMLVLLGIALTVAAYQLRRRLGAPRTR